jgi:hypothetical protein
MTTVSTQQEYRKEASFAATPAEVPEQDFYAQEAEFRSGVVAAQSPFHLTLAAAFGGFAPAESDQPFVYLDLGCGEASSLCAFAALYPHGKFYGVDFNGKHIEAGRAHIERLGLRNVHLYHLDFRDLKSLDIPQCQYVTMHGIYSWLAEEPQRAVISFIKDKLQAGGIFAVEYAAMPGMASVPPLWRLVQEMVPVEQGVSEHARGELGIELVRKFARRGLGYLAANPRARRAVAHYAQPDPGGYAAEHFAHNALASAFRPRYFAEVVAELAPAGLRFAARADLALNLREVSTPPAHVPMMREIADPILRETLLDYIRNETNRFDVFVKDTEPDFDSANQFLAEKVRLLARNERSKQSSLVKINPFCQFNLSGPLISEVVEASYDRAVTGSEVFGERLAATEAARTIKKLVAAGQHFVCRHAETELGQHLEIDQPKVSSLNMWLLERAVARFSRTQLLSRYTGGAAVPLSQLEVLLVQQWLTSGKSVAVDNVKKHLEKEERPLMTPKGPANPQKITLSVLHEVFDALIQRKQGNLIRLGIFHG